MNQLYGYLLKYNLNTNSMTRHKIITKYKDNYIYVDNNGGLNEIRHINNYTILFKTFKDFKVNWNNYNYSYNSYIFIVIPSKHKVDFGVVYRTIREKLQIDCINRQIESAERELQVTENEQSMLNSRLDIIEEKINSLNFKIYQLKEKKKNEQ